MSFVVRDSNQVEYEEFGKFHLKVDDIDDGLLLEAEKYHINSCEWHYDQTQVGDYCEEFAKEVEKEHIDVPKSHYA